MQHGHFLHIKAIGWPYAFLSAFLTYRDKSLIPIYKKCPAIWQSIRSISAMLPRAIPTLDSVVYYDSTFGQVKQENDRGKLHSKSGPLKG